MSGIVLPAAAIAARRGVRGPAIGVTPPDPGPVVGGVGGPEQGFMFPPIADTTTGDWYVDTSAGTNGDGSFGSPFNTLAAGLAALSSGQTLLVRGGVIPTTGIWRDTAWASETRVMAYGSETVTLDRQNAGSNDVLEFNGAQNELWHGFTVRNGNGRGIRVVNSAGTHLSRIAVHACLGDGIQHYNSSNCTVRDFHVYALGDGASQHTNVPDGIVATANSGQQCDSVWYVRGVVRNAPDDAGDLFRAKNSGFLDVVVYRAGYYWNGNVAGDGNGLKLGGGVGATSNVARGCLVLACRANGLDGNQITGDAPPMELAYCTVVDCGSLGIDANGDASNQANTVRDLVTRGNGSDGNQGAGSGTYAGAHVTIARTSWSLALGNPLFVNPANFDYSLAAGSPAIGVGFGGTNLGASVTALTLAAEALG